MRRRKTGVIQKEIDDAMSASCTYHLDHDDFNKLEVLKLSPQILYMIAGLFKEKNLKKDEHALLMHIHQRRNYLLVADVVLHPDKNDKQILCLGFQDAPSRQSSYDYLYQVVVREGSYNIGDILDKLPKEAELHISSA